jgi:hypothetical protein
MLFAKLRGQMRLSNQNWLHMTSIHRVHILKWKLQHNCQKRSHAGDCLRRSEICRCVQNTSFLDIWQYFNRHLVDGNTIVHIYIPLNRSDHDCSSKWEQSDHSRIVTWAMITENGSRLIGERNWIILSIVQDRLQKTQAFHLCIIQIVSSFHRSIVTSPWDISWRTTQWLQLRLLTSQWIHKKSIQAWQQPWTPSRVLTRRLFFVATNRERLLTFESCDLISLIWWNFFKWLDPSWLFSGMSSLTLQVFLRVICEVKSLCELFRDIFTKDEVPSTQMLVRSSAIVLFTDYTIIVRNVPIWEVSRFTIVSI